MESLKPSWLCISFNTLNLHFFSLFQCVPSLSCLEVYLGENSGISLTTILSWWWNSRKEESKEIKSRWELNRNEYFYIILLNKVIKPSILDCLAKILKIKFLVRYSYYPSRLSNFPKGFKVLRSSLIRLSFKSFSLIDLIRLSFEIGRCFECLF